MSALAEIYTALSDIAIGGVKCRNLPKVKLVVNDSDLPLRLLVPSTGGEMEYVGIGTLGSIEWSIRDVCLWAPLTGGGIQQVAEPMMDYIKAYLTAVKGLRNPSSQSVITRIGVQLGPLLWGEVDYWAIDCNLNVEEIL
jgi:hypothetical protein